MTVSLALRKVAIVPKLNSLSLHEHICNTTDPPLRLEALPKYNKWMHGLLAYGLLYFHVARIAVVKAKGTSNYLSIDSGTKAESPQGYYGHARLVQRPCL